MQFIILQKKKEDNTMYFL